MPDGELTHLLPNMDHLPLRHLLPASIHTVGSLSGLQPTLEHKILNLHLTGSLTPRNRSGKSQLSMSTHTSIHTPALSTTSMAQEPSLTRATEPSPPSPSSTSCMATTQRLPVHTLQSHREPPSPPLTRNTTPLTAASTRMTAQGLS